MGYADVGCNFSHYFRSREAVAGFRFGSFKPYEISIQQVPDDDVMIDEDEDLHL